MYAILEHPTPRRPLQQQPPHAGTYHARLAVWLQYSKVGRCMLAAGTVSIRWEVEGQTDKLQCSDIFP